MKNVERKGSIKIHRQLVEELKAQIHRHGSVGNVATCLRGRPEFLGLTSAALHAWLNQRKPTRYRISQLRLALPILKRADPASYLRIAGRGRLSEELKRQTTRRFRRVVKRIGSYEDVAQALRSFPGFGSTMPMVIIGWAAGKCTGRTLRAIELLEKPEKSGHNHPRPVPEQVGRLKMARRVKTALGRYGSISNIARMLSRFTEFSFVYRMLAELENSHAWAVIRILEDGRTSQFGVTAKQCTALLKRLFPHTREQSCLKVLKLLINQGLIRKRRDDPRFYVLRERLPEWADTDPVGRAFLTDDGARSHPEIDVVFDNSR